MKYKLDKLGKVKHILHGVQALFIFVAWALTLAVFTKPGSFGGQTGFFFALCFLSVPALVYQVMVPVWPRAQRFANVYAYASIDILYMLLWFSASIAVAVWNAAGINEGKSTNKDSDGSCNYFAYGDSSKCSVSKASVGFGILIFSLFAGTTTISVLFVMRWRASGVMPGRKEGPAGTAFNTTDHSKDIWSTTIEERDEDEPDQRRRYGQMTPEEDGQGLLHQASHDPHPGELSYQPAHTMHDSQDYDQYVPSALSSGGYNHDAASTYQPPPLSQNMDERLPYPTGRYDRV